MKLAIIAAVSKNGVIGKNGKIPWKFREDLQRFKKITTGRVVIMGRKTYDSLGQPLPNRLNIIVTRQNLDLSNQGCAVAGSFEQALTIAQNALNAKSEEYRDEEVFCIGGAEIYRLAMPIADKIYLTRIEKEFEGNTFFPAIDMDIWRCVYEKGAGCHGEEPNRFWAYYLEFDRSKIIIPE